MIYQNQGCKEKAKGGREMKSQVVRGCIGCMIVGA